MREKTRWGERLEKHKLGMEGGRRQWVTRKHELKSKRQHGSCLLGQQDHQIMVNETSYAGQSNIIYPGEILLSESTGYDRAVFVPRVSGSCAILKFVPSEFYCKGRVSFFWKRRGVG